ncbi:MAG: HD domain-containing protein [Flavobacteriaceae bacterium]|nr:HD domain-containing protein [Flavobacteriaceae bacterium]
MYFCIQDNYKSLNKLKILNDPIYGFISIPNELIFDIIEHRYFQRLRRISQMGLSYLVYPGAHHTRFHHALGCMHLMQKAIRVLKFKGVVITDEESNALLIAILLHDIGHGAFSHALENSIVEGISHEYISLQFMLALNDEFDGKLDLAIKIFKGNYKRLFFHQLITSQLDIDRMDYLKRDSFYTGVSEGNINSERIITMFNVVDNDLVIEYKGIYSIEKFLTARRLMYWQVYLHKTGLVAEKTLVKVLKRAKELSRKGIVLPASPAFSYFLENAVNTENWHNKSLNIFNDLDDCDVLSAIKQWQTHDDFTLSTLSKMIIDRKLPRVIIKNEAPKKTELKILNKNLLSVYPIKKSETSYFVDYGKIENLAYNKNQDPIKILYKNGDVTTFLRASDFNRSETLTKPIVKFYMYYPKLL